MFKVGDAVCLNPKYSMKVDVTVGYITGETYSGDPDQHLIDWADGKKGNIELNPKDDYLIKV